jgi:hypothetical protein
MNKDSWITLALSVPVGIATALITSIIQNWFRGRGLTRQIARERRIQREYVEAYKYKHYPYELTHYLLKTLINLVMEAGLYLMAFIFTASIREISMLEQIANLSPPSAPVEHRILWSATAMMALFASRVTYRLARYHRILERVKFFELYQSEVPAHLRIAQ